MSTVLITGASRGIGLAAARMLAGRGWRVAMIARDAARLERAAAELRRSIPGASAVALPADLTRLGEVPRLLDRVSAATDRVGALVINHAAIVVERGGTAEGLDLNFAVNYLSYAALATGIVTWFADAPPSRIVSLSAEVHRLADLDVEALSAPHDYDGCMAYARAKAAVTAFSGALGQQRPAGPTIYCSLHPGSLETDALREFRAEYVRRHGAREFAAPAPPEAGAAHVVRLVEGPPPAANGAYFVMDREAAPADFTTDDAMVGRLVELTEATLRRHAPAVLAGWLRAGGDSGVA
jgi:NAD(P)-dependent dehydrogenase (short-subunit alcohol dehydrogenase family)